MLTTLKSFGGASTSTVEAFERRNQLVLPSDYKEFFIQNNGGQLDSMACFVKDLNEGILVEIFLGIDQQERTFNSEFWLNKFGPEMPTGFLVIALGATGMFILGTEGPSAGVYFWDDAHAFKGSSEEGGNTYRLTKTFTEFLDSLKPVE